MNAVFSKEKITEVMYKMSAYYRPDQIGIVVQNKEKIPPEMIKGNNKITLDDQQISLFINKSCPEDSLYVLPLSQIKEHLSIKP